MRQIVSIICFILVLQSAKSQTNYASGSIPSELRSRASAVVRSSETSIEIKDLNNVTIRVKKVVTILNNNGDREAEMVVIYDKTKQIKSIKALIYNELGLPAGKISEKDFKDESAGSDYSLFEDFRRKRFLPAITSYPFTLEFECEISSNQSLSLPDWYTGNSTGVSVENARLTIMSKPEFNLRYKQSNIPGQPVQSANSQGYTTYTWEIKNLKALKDEPYSPDPEQYLPSVKVAIEKFLYRGISGSFTNWKEYGQWTYDKLLKGRDAISSQTSAYIKELIKDISEPKLKAKKIYEFVQQKTRYVSVQIGAGGFQPASAFEVDRLSYGDCKGLVNYTRALLAVAGIESYYTVVEAGNLKKDAIPDFASINQFNHIILCIPFRNDTTWVDCTSKTLPFGYLGDFTDDRLAVAITPGGGMLIRTPKYAPEDSKQLRKGNFFIDASGNIRGEMSTTFKGWQYENREMLVGEPYDEQVKKLREIYNFNNLDVESLNLNQEKNIKPVTTEILKFSAKGYGSISGAHLYITANAANHSKPINEVSNRVNPVYINRGYTDIDEIEYTMPDNYHIETRPQNLTIDKPFGTYSISFEINENKATYTRKITLNEGLYPAEKYEELVSFFQKVSEADNSRIILVR